MRREWFSHPASSNVYFCLSTMMTIVIPTMIVMNVKKKWSNIKNLEFLKYIVMYLSYLLIYQLFIAIENITFTFYFMELGKPSLWNSVKTTEKIKQNKQTKKLTKNTKPRRESRKENSVLKVALAWRVYLNFINLTFTFQDLIGLRR